MEISMPAGAWVVYHDAAEVPLKAERIGTAVKGLRMDREPQNTNQTKPVSGGRLRAMKAMSGLLVLLWMLGGWGDRRPGSQGNRGCLDHADWEASAAGKPLAGPG